MEYRLKHQNETIEALLDAFETCSYGIGIKKLCNVEIERTDYDTTIVLKTKDPDKMLNINDVLVLGIIIGRDYLAECKMCSDIEKLRQAKAEIYVKKKED